MQEISTEMIGGNWSRKNPAIEYTLVLGLLASPPGISSCLLAVCMLLLRGSGMQHLSMTECIAGKEISCHDTELTTLGHVAVLCLSINIHSKHI